jgi:hypothetical protein
MLEFYLGGCGYAISSPQLDYKPTGWKNNTSLVPISYFCMDINIVAGESQVHHTIFAAYILHLDAKIYIADSI